MRKSLLLLPGPVPVAQPVLEAMARPMISHRGPQFAEHTDDILRQLGKTGDEIIQLKIDGACT